MAQISTLPTTNKAYKFQVPLLILTENSLCTSKTLQAVLIWKIGCMSYKQKHAPLFFESANFENSLVYLIKLKHFVYWNLL